MNYNKFIDHTLLKADATEIDIQKLCIEAVHYNFKSVCINPFWIDKVKKILAEEKKKQPASDVKICTVVGFPLGANDCYVKREEASKAIAQGADEIDMVVNIGAIKSGHWTLIKQEIETIRKIAKKQILKIIIETCYLNEKEKIMISKIGVDAEVDFLKTSTGFGTKGATIEDVRLMKQIAQAYNREVKASGGIKTFENMQQMIDAGATRIGTSHGVSLINKSSDNQTSLY